MKRRPSSLLLIYLITFLFIIIFLALLGYSEFNRSTDEPVLNDPEMESFDPSSFDLYILPPDHGDLVSNPSSPLPSNPLPSTSSDIFPLSRLKSGHHTNIYDLIVVNQVGIDEIDSDNGYTLLHYLARSYNLVALKFLLNQNIYGVDGVNKVSSRKSGGDTPLHLAVTHPNLILALFITNLLIQYKADPSIPNEKGQTARDLAEQQQSSHMDDRILKVIDGEYDPRTEFETETKTFLDFAFGSRGPPKDPYFFK